MSKIEIKVYALPTEKASHIKLIPKGEFEQIDGELVKLKEDRYHWFEESSEFGYQSIALYTTNSDVVKDEDIIIEIASKKLGKYLYDGLNKTHDLVVDKITYPFNTPEYFKRILATTDKDLWEVIKSHGNTNSCYIGKSLDKISPEFQQAWIKNMNANTPIVDAVMEMEQFYVEGNYTNICVSCNKMFHNTDKRGFICSECGLTPKLNPQGYVTILPVKEKMYTKEDVVKLFVLEREFRNRTSHFIDKEDLPKWINEQNL